MILYAKEKKSPPYCQFLSIHVRSEGVNIFATRVGSKDNSSPWRYYSYAALLIATQHTTSVSIVFPHLVIIDVNHENGQTFMV